MNDRVAGLGRALSLSASFTSTTLLLTSIIHSTSSSLLFTYHPSLTITYYSTASTTTTNMYDMYPTYLKKNSTKRLRVRVQGVPISRHGDESSRPGAEVLGTSEEQWQQGQPAL